MQIGTDIQIVKSCLESENISNNQFSNNLKTFIGFGFNKNIRFWFNKNIMEQNQSYVKDMTAAANETPLMELKLGKWERTK